MVKPDFKNPSEYMRQKRPHLFSDSQIIEEPVLDKPKLEYFLETLTSRKQEQAFEEFCLRLAQLEICPNLKPQTGPTGGGDRIKSDSSTYPVSPVLIERCYFGSPTPGTNELWGFAFSCKKDWSSKAKDDLKKLGEYERRYSKVYFISNQYIRDKKRAELELEYSKKYNFEVHILDRNWIINKIIENKREQIAIELLNIKTEKIKGRHIGTNDTERQSELDELLSKLRDIPKYEGNDYAIAKDYLLAAKLSRGLEKPRHEIEGLFRRSLDLAKQNRFKSLSIKCGYDYAWTILWWFDDWAVLLNLYNEIEPNLKGTYDAEECEMFINLLNLILSGINSGNLTCDRNVFDSKVKFVKDELNRLANDSERPNNALHARTLLLLMDLTESIHEKDNNKAVNTFKSLKKCLRESNGMGTYPLKGFIYSLTEMGDFIGDLPGYDELFAEMRRIGSKRLGETEDGEMLYKRGIQLLDKDDLSNALKVLGQASIKLSKEETKPLSVRIFLCCAEVYSKMGLHWAARMETITAAHITVSKIESIDKFPFFALIAIRKMCYLELTLGRILPFLAWYELNKSTLGFLKSKGLDVSKFEKDSFDMDALLGCLMLNMGKDNLLKLKDLKSALEGLELYVSSVVFSYAAEDFQQVLNELPEKLAKTENELHDLFNKWKEQPAARQFINHVQDQIAEYIEYKLIIMNVEFQFKVKNEVGLIYFAENLMGVLEAAFSLANWQNHAFIIERIVFKIDYGESGQNPPVISIKRNDDDVIELFWKDDAISWMNNSNSKALIDCFKSVLFSILINFSIDPIEEIKKELDLWYKEGTFDRALSRSPLKIPLSDIIGVERYGIDYWLPKTATSQKI